MSTDRSLSPGEGREALPGDFAWPHTWPDEWQQIAEHRVAESASVYSLPDGGFGGSVEGGRIKKTAEDEGALREALVEALVAKGWDECEIHRGEIRVLVARAQSPASQLTEYRRALEDIDRHHSMPDGESWEAAYNEVCDIARAALIRERGQA